MPNIPVRLACADYARVLPLASGLVKADNIDLSIEIGRDGSWPIRAELLRRVLTDPELDGGESSMARHLRRIDEGDRSFVALPIFVLRGFTVRDLYVRKDGPVRNPQDLIGKRLGIYSWFASASIWYRHAQLAMGVPLDNVEWWVGYIEGTAEAVNLPDTVVLPQGVRRVPKDRFLAEMLVAGEIDAMWSPPRPSLFEPRQGPIVRLLTDFRAIETEYYKNAGVFPAQHIIVIRRSIWERYPCIARSLTNAFNASTSSFEASQRGFPDAFPWMEAELDATAALFGSNPHTEGLTEINRRSVQAFIDQAKDSKLISRHISVDEYFEDFLNSEGYHDR
jgi:4,5-dihydroxyphthalate decarboxylase